MTVMLVFQPRYRMLPAVSVNNDVVVISDCGPPMSPGEPHGNLGRKEHLPSSSQQTTAAAHGEP